MDARTAKGEFVAVKCAAIPDTMVEAEFFGYEKWAFSGANARLTRGLAASVRRAALCQDAVPE